MKISYQNWTKSTKSLQCLAVIIAAKNKKTVFLDDSDVYYQPRFGSNLAQNSHQFDHTNRNMTSIH